MTDDIRVLYNETCPICRFEIGAYRREAEAAGAAIGFEGLEAATDWGLTPDAAARRLHVAEGSGRIVSGLAAFRLIWARLPRWRWAARVAGWPVVEPVLAFLYDRIAAPLLYRAHLRRQRRGR